jgi:hypothetical protein
VAELDRAELAASDLLSVVGLRREQLTEPDALIPFTAHVMLFENAARALRDPCFGFRLGSAVELTEAGLLAYVILNSHDLGGALQNLCRYLPILTEGCVCELRREADEVRLLFSLVDPGGISARQLHEFGVTLMARICEAITGHRVRPVRVELRHETACPTLARHLGLPVRVDQPYSALVLDAASLAAPVVNADARLLDLLRRYADEVLARRAAKDDLGPGRALDPRKPPYRSGRCGAAGPQPRHERSDPGTTIGRKRAHAGWPGRRVAPTDRQQISDGPDLCARAHHLPARLQQP